MFAVVEISGKQYTVRENDRIKVARLANEIGDTVTFDTVLLYENEGATVVGQPTVENIQVAATIVEHDKDDKVLVFKKKRRKDYRNKNGHRQDYSLIKIDSITAN